MLYSSALARADWNRFYTDCNRQGYEDPYEDEYEDEENFDEIFYEDSFAD